MCNFLSGIVTLEKYPRILCANLLHHEITVDAFKLKPEQYREWEWTSDDDGWSLRVRAAPGENANELKSAILAKYPNRSACLMVCIIQIIARKRKNINLEGLTSVPLAAAVGSFAAPAGADPPKGLSPGQAGELLAFVRACPGGIRNEPMIALLLRLALRACEVAALLLDDIAWRQGIVTVRGKGNRADQVPLPVDVGRPLACYLREGRPVGTAHRQVFLALDAPHGPLAGSAVTSVAGRALRDAGISGHGAAHLLRHTAACGVLAAGGGLAEAGQLLRHAGPQVTAVYARSDITALRTIARPWPEGAGS